jgi:hypothetical protein
MNSSGMSIKILSVIKLLTTFPTFIILQPLLQEKMTLLVFITDFLYSASSMRIITLIGQ